MGRTSKRRAKPRNIARGIQRFLTKQFFSILGSLIGLRNQPSNQNIAGFEQNYLSILRTNQQNLNSITTANTPEPQRTNAAQGENNSGNNTGNNLGVNAENNSENNPGNNLKANQETGNLQRQTQRTTQGILQKTTRKTIQKITRK